MRWKVTEMPRSSKLTVLVAENEPLVAISVEQILDDLGHHVIGPVSNLPDLLKISTTADFDIALLDVTLSNEEEVYPAADRLSARGIPFAFMTADHPDFLPPSHVAHCILTKPFSWQQLVDCLNALANARKDATELSAT
jgi:CheY-like chemotaxis protein